ncbi:transcriptional regulator XRE family [Candidatus Termititenax persephonae]|uniref:Transcriptional regulator XRE family n=1 Tax=Candidatus Termititenax persephonae TaxID=2218525 RepID=A0A388TJ33_9BACT|nr:transcriptional regulator XRE family [Candidatus Termititenax persephonae]
MDITKVKDPILKKLGNKVKYYREKRGFNRDRFAIEAEVSKYYLYRLEYGNISPGILRLKQIADFLDIRVKDLIDF